MMQLTDGKPVLDPGICFICEQVNEGRFVDTLLNYEPAFFTPLIGRKYVCEGCVLEMARLLGWGNKELIVAELDQANTRIRVLEDAAHRAQAVLDS